MCKCFYDSSQTLTCVKRNNNNLFTYVTSAVLITMVRTYFGRENVE